MATTKKRKKQQKKRRQKKRTSAVTRKRGRKGKPKVHFYEVACRSESATIERMSKKDEENDSPRTGDYPGPRLR